MRRIYQLYVMVISLAVLSLGATLYAQGQGSPNVPLLVNVNDHPSAGYNDCWGYTAPNGREYALLGVINGTSIIDITDAQSGNATEVAFISSPSSIWKDIKTYQQYAYVVTEASTQMQIIDLSNLPASATLVGTYSGFTSGPHNISIDEASGILYGAEDNNFNQAVRVISLANPLAPVEIATFGPDCHDMVGQNGRVYVAEGTQPSLSIWDMTTPASPSLISRIQVPAAGYVHNVWPTEDDQYMMSTEETTGKTIKYWDISTPTNAVLLSEVLAPDALAHNAHVKNGFSYVSHYGDGMRIYDLSDPANVFEAGYYDTFPGGGGFTGAWGAFPFFASGKVLIADQSTGLYVVFFAGAVDADQLDPAAPSGASAYSDYQSPNAMTLTWTDPTALINGDPLLPSDFVVVIERDGAPLTEVAGGTGSFTDSGLNDGQFYEYNLVTRVTANDSLSSAANAGWTAGGSPIPAAPVITKLEGTDQQIAITWRNSGTNADGTPLDDLAAVRLYQDGTAVASFSQNAADSGAVQTVTFVPSSPGRYSWELTTIDNEITQNESGRSNATYTPREAALTDQFNTAGQPDVTLWINDGTQVNNRAVNPPSAPNSLNLNANPDGEDIIDAWPMNTAGLENSGISFNYAYQPQGTGNSPETGDSLSVYFRNSEGRWVLVRAYPGRTLANFTQQAIDLATAPNGGGSFFHSQFQVRFRSTGSASATDLFDDWFIDDVSLSVSGAAITVSQTTLVFDSTLVGGVTTSSLEVRNIGDAPVIVSDILSTNTDFSVDINSFTLGPGSRQVVNVTFQPGQPGLINGLLRIASNDVNNDTLDVAVRGRGFTPTGIGEGDVLPATFAVSPNYPNPFNPSTTIAFQLPSSASTRLIIYNMLGQKVRTLVNGMMTAGFHQAVWDGRNENGAAVGSGLYIYRFSAGGFQHVQKMILLK